MIATISADIVRSTSLKTEDLIALRNCLKELLDDFEKDYPGFWARIVRGDSIECVVPEYRYSLRIAILIKLFVKMQVGAYECHELLQRYGIRLSIGIADIGYADKTEDILNLYYALNEFDCVFQYTRSGRIAVTRAKQEQVSEFLEEREQKH